MGLFKTLLIIIIAIILLAYFMPNVYENGKNWVFDKVKDFTSNKVSDTAEDKLTYTNETYGKDYGKIFGLKLCKADIDCQDAFKINNMKCYETGTCYVEVQ